jgi:predicted GIY-YIG superfamily endonuclease
MGFYVYILQCKDESYYTGHTDDMDKRLFEHQNGIIKTCYTYRRRPVDVIYVEMFSTRDEAFFAEQQIKEWSRRKKQALIKKDWQEIKRLSNLKISSPLDSSILRQAQE